MKNIAKGMNSEATDLNITCIPLDDVMKYDKERFNTNNHWDVRPADYDEVLQKSNMSYWVNSFRPTYTVINVDEKELRWIREAYKVGCLTGRFPHYHDDDMEAFLKKYAALDYIFKDTKYFVRTDTVSLKEGTHGCGPYGSLKEIVESLVTCRQGHCPLSRMGHTLTIYLLPWVTLDVDTEFRVFVCDNRVTAISQQHLYQSNQVLSKLSEPERTEKIKEWTATIVAFHRDTVRHRITHISSYVMDFAILKDGSPYFIEINSFGANYASGSALFHWLNDSEKLLGQTDTLWFRYTL